MSTATDPARLLYDWTGHPDHRRRLGFWILGALVLHASAYLLFRATDPPPSSLEPSKAKIHILAPDSEAARLLAPRIAAADPALFAADRLATRPLPDPAIPDYRPSFENAEPPLVALPEPVRELLPPLPRDDGPVVVNDGRASPRPLPAPARDTKVVFAGDLASRSVTSRPNAAFTARPGENLAPATYLVAVAPTGEVRHVVEIERTASPRINAVAIPYLMGFRFDPTPTATDVAWGEATIHWGLDVRRERL